MSYRAGHGKGKGQPRIEVLPPDEQPWPVPALEAVTTGPVERRPDGTLSGSAAGKALGRRGGLANQRRVRLIDSLGLAHIGAETSFGPYRLAAEDFVKFHLAELAKSAGGIVGSGPSTMVASAGLQLAASRWAFDTGARMNDLAMFKVGSSFANDSRQNLMAAHEMAIREAKGRAPEDWATQIARIDAEGEAETEARRVAERAARDGIAAVSS